MQKSNFKLEVDAQVFLRIVKHAKQNYPGSSTGSLLGLDQKNAARVTNCFAFQRKDVMEDGGPSKEKDDFTEHQYEMLRALSEIRVDASSVGWYESTHYGNFLTDGFIENAYLFQKTVPNSVVMVYNPYLQKLGKCGFQAFRLTDTAMALREKNQDGDDPFEGLNSSELLEEVEILVEMNAYVETLLLQMSTDQTVDGLDMNDSTDGMERSLGLLLDSIDEFQGHQREMQMFDRQTRAMKDKQSKMQRVPKAGDTISLSRQVQEHSVNLERLLAENMEKLHILDNTEETENILTAMAQ